MPEPRSPEPARLGSCLVERLGIRPPKRPGRCSPALGRPQVCSAAVPVSHPKSVLPSGVRAALRSSELSRSSACPAHYLLEGGTSHRKAMQRARDTIFSWCTDGLKAGLDAVQRKSTGRYPYNNNFANKAEQGLSFSRQESAQRAYSLLVERRYGPAWYRNCSYWEILHTRYDQFCSETD